MNDQTDSWIDAALEELAAADARCVVRLEVEVAVLRAWEAQHAAARSDRPNRMAFLPGWGKMAALLAVPATAAALAAALLVPRRPATADRVSSAVRARPPAGASPLVAPPAPSIVRRQGPRTSGRFSDRRPTPHMEYVIVPEPFADPDTLHVVRVRMPGTTLATLGMPIGNPDARGLVDVEMLVGDDGVARSIRTETFARENTDGVGVRR